MKKSNYSIITLVVICSAFVFSISSCKKEEADDPNITYKSVNKSVTSVVVNEFNRDSIDLNEDGKQDIYFSAIITSTLDTAVLYLQGLGAATYVDSTQFFGIAYKAKNLYSDQQPNLLSTKSEWWNISYVAIKLGTEKKGYAGVGDVFIPVVFIPIGTTNTHYGWLRVNVTTDFRTIKLVDYAYSILPDTPIKMGAK